MLRRIALPLLLAVACATTPEREVLMTVEVENRTPGRVHVALEELDSGTKRYLGSVEAGVTSPPMRVSLPGVVPVRVLVGSSLAGVSPVGTMPYLSPRALRFVVEPTASSRVTIRPRGA